MHERATQGGIFGSSEVGPGTWYAVWWTMREARRAGGSVRDHRRLPMKRKGPWWCGSHRQGAHASHVAFGVGRVDGKGRPQVSLREGSGRAPPRQTFERLSACAFGVAGRTSWGSSLSTLTARTLPQAAAMTSDWSSDRPFARPCPKISRWLYWLWPTYSGAMRNATMCCWISGSVRMKNTRPATGAVRDSKRRASMASSTAPSR